MNRFMTATALTLALGLAAPALAQTGAGAAPNSADQPAAGESGARSSTAAAVGSSGGANAMMGMKVQELIGREVVNASGKDIGKIDDIVVSDQDQAIYAVIGVGGFLGLGEKDVAIPFEQLRLGAENVILMSERSESDLKEMPAYKEGKWKSVEPEQALGVR